MILDSFTWRVRAFKLSWQMQIWSYWCWIKQLQEAISLLEVGSDRPVHRNSKFSCTFTDLHVQRFHLYNIYDKTLFKSPLNKTQCSSLCEPYECTKLFQQVLKDKDEYLQVLAKQWIINIRKWNLMLDQVYTLILGKQTHQILMEVRNY